MSDYLSSYVLQALQDPSKLEPPDAQQANGNLEVLESLYLERNNGVDAVRRAWETIKRLRPELAPLAEKKRLRLVKFNDLKDVKPPKYALSAALDGEAPPYAIYVNGMNMLYGDRGTGKTFITIDFACRLALANPERHVIYTSNEGVAGLYGRYRAWTLHYNGGNLVDNFHLWPNALQATNQDEVGQFISDLEQNQYQPVMVIVDTMARAAKGLNENDTKDMVVFMDAYEQIAARLGCGVLFIHHVNRMGAIRGSSVFDGALDSMLKVVASDGRITVYNRYDKGGKNKHREEAPDMQFAILPVTVAEMRDDENPGADKQAVAIRAEKIIDDPTEELTDNQRDILTAMVGFDEGVAAQTVAETTDIHIRTVRRNLNSLLDAGYVSKMTTPGGSSTGMFKLTSSGQERLKV